MKKWQPKNKNKNKNKKRLDECGTNLGPDYGTTMWFVWNIVIRENPKDLFAPREDIIKKNARIF